jgi:glycosyltransferase involved in cell wall biosynthesis
MRLLFTALQWCSGVRFVLLVAETGLPQCVHYRVEHKRELFANLGYQVVVIDRSQAGRRLLPFLWLSSLLILYRVPANSKVIKLVESARRHAIPVAWEVDDLIFNSTVLRLNRGLESVEPAIRASVIAAASDYHEALSLSDFGIASTPFLARSMRQAGLPQVFVLENGIDQETLAYARQLRLIAAESQRISGDELHPIRILYGSGTDTHDDDLAFIAPALDQLMAQQSKVVLRLVGPLRLPYCLKRHGSRIERFSLRPFSAYLKLLAECQISVCPLLPSSFNDAKSCIKYLEASMLAIPSICSPCESYVTTIRHGDNGFLCSGEAEWLKCLTMLVVDSALRRKIGGQALEDVQHRLSLSALSARQLQPLLEAVSLPVP